MSLFDAGFGFLQDLIVGFNWFVAFYFVALNGSYMILFGVSLLEVWKFVRRTFFSDYRQIMQSDMTWPISILVPAHDEEKTIVETVRSLLMVNYGEFEIVVINDGSTDRTLDRLKEAFELQVFPEVIRRRLPTETVRGVYRSARYPELRIIDKANGGKADALNAGINAAQYPLFCALDADWRIIAVNQSALAFAGLARETVFGRVLWDVIPAASQMEYGAYLRRAMAQSQRLSFEAESRLDPGRFYRAVVLPLAADAGIAIAFHEITRRHGDFALAGVAAAFVLSESGEVSEARIVLFAVDERPVRASAAEAALLGWRLDDHEAIGEAGDLAAQGVEPVPTVHGSTEFRRRLTAVAVRRALQQATIGRTHP